MDAVLAADQEGCGPSTGWARLIARGRLVHWLAPTLQLALFVAVAAPDIFGVKGWKWMAGLIVLYVVAEWFRGLARGGVLDRYRKVFEDISELISSIAGTQSGEQAPQILQSPSDAISLLLRRACELARTSLNPPPGCEITASLLLPEFKGKRLIGLKVAEQDDYRPSRDHPIIPLDAPGAPVTYCRGVPSSIPSTDAEKHPRVKERTYKSVGTFPIVVGESGTTGRVIAVLSLDATEPYTFDAGGVKKLSPFLSPIAQLVGLALVTKRAGGQNVQGQQ